MSDPCGRHLIAELYECNPLILNDISYIAKILIEAVLYVRAEVQEIAFHKLVPTGISGVMIVSESHLAIHTFPEQKHASLDIYSFNQRINPNELYNYIVNKIQAPCSYVKELIRGCGEILEKTLD